MSEKRAAIAECYGEAFADLPLDLPAPAPSGDTHAWHLYVVRLREETPMRRDDFIAQMATAGVGCSVHFIPLHKHPYWRQRYSLSDQAFPVASREFERVASLPIFFSMTDAQVLKVINAVRQVLA
jgi:dTDP-4-amino-4,6-dideoxygalactose transaminase